MEEWNPKILEKDLQDDELGLPSQANIVRNKISYNFAFGSNSLSFIFLDIFAWPRIFGLFFHVFDHIFGHNFRSKWPILLIFELSLTN